MSAPLTPAVRSWQRGCLGRGGTGQARCLATFQPLRPGLTRLGQGGWGLRGVLTPVWQLFAAGCGRGLGRNTHVAFLYGLCTWGSLGFFTTWWPQRSQIACVAPRTRTHSSQGRKPLMICLGSHTRPFHPLALPTTKVPLGPRKGNIDFLLSTTSFWDGKL